MKAATKTAGTGADRVCAWAPGVRKNPTPLALPCHFSKTDNGFSKADNGFSETDNGFSKANNGFSKANNGFSETDNGFSETDNGFSATDCHFSKTNSRFSKVDCGFSDMVPSWCKTIPSACLTSFRKRLVFRKVHDRLNQPAPALLVRVVWITKRKHHGNRFSFCQRSQRLA